MLKVLRPDAPRHWAEREAALTAAVRRLGVRAPEVHSLGEVNGQPAIEFERINGPSLWDLLVKDRSPVEALVGQFSSVHRTILAAGLPEQMPDMVRRLCRKIENAPRLNRIERTEAVSLTQKLSRGAALLHGDFHPGNVLMASDGPVVIDWFDAMIGHPVADIVRSSLLTRAQPDGNQPPHLPGSTPELLRHIHTAYLRAFTGELTHCGTTLRTWEAVLAAARLEEGAESTESNLLQLWRKHREPTTTSPLTELTPTGPAGPLTGTNR